MNEQGSLGKATYRDQLSREPNRVRMQDGPKSQQTQDQCKYKTVKTCLYESRLQRGTPFPLWMSSYLGQWVEVMGRLFGKYLSCMYFALPVHPVRSMVCFRLFVRSWKCRNSKNFRTTNQLGWEEGTPEQPPQGQGPPGRNILFGTQLPRLRTGNLSVSLENEHTLAIRAFPSASNKRFS